MDGDSAIPEASEESVRAHAPKAIYVNPTLQKPDDDHHPRAPARRHLLDRAPAGRADRRGRRLRLHSDPRASAARAIAPDICWHIAGLAECIGAGLRLAYVVAPDARSGWSFNSAMRALTVMASPVAAAIATRWIEDGAADTILRFIRAETMARQRIAATILEPGPTSPTH